MKVKQLILELLEMPMDSEVILAIQNDSKYTYRKAEIVVDYDNREIGIISPE